LMLADADNSFSYSGDGSSYISIWNAVENVAATFPTSPVICGSSQVTRPADNVTIPTSLFDFNAAAGTVFVEYSATEYSGTKYCWSLSDGSVNEWITLAASSTADAKPRIIVYDGGSPQADFKGTARTPGDNVKAAVSWQANSINAAVDGVSLTEDTSATIPTPTTLYVGGNSTGASPLNGTIRKFYYYNTALTQAQREGLSAGTTDPTTLSPALSLDFVNRTYSRGGDPFAETVLSDDFSGYGSTAEMQTVWPDVSGGLGTLSSAALLVTLDTADTLGGNEATIQTIIGQAYEISAEVIAVTGTGTGKFTAGSTTGASDLYASATTLTAATYKATFVATTVETFIGLYAVGVATDTVKWDNITIKRVELYLTGVDSTHGLSATESFDITYDDATTGTQAAVGGELTLVATNNPLARVTA